MYFVVSSSSRSVASLSPTFVYFLFKFKKNTRVCAFFAGLIDLLPLAVASIRFHTTAHNRHITPIRALPNGPFLFYFSSFFFGFFEIINDSRATAKKSLRIRPRTQEYFLPCTTGCTQYRYTTQQQKRTLFGKIIKNTFHFNIGYLSFKKIKYILVYKKWRREERNTQKLNRNNWEFSNKLV